MIATPSFVKPNAHYDASKDEPHRQFILWSPDRVDLGDYETGKQHFADALAFAVAMQAPTFLPGIVAEMSMNARADEMEIGFLEALAAKAVTGRAGVMDEATAEFVHNKFDISIESQRAGEREAKTFLEMARREGNPGPIASMLIAIAKGNPIFGATGFVWSICAAVYSGASN